MNVNLLIVYMSAYPKYFSFSKKNPQICYNNALHLQKLVGYNFKILKSKVLGLLSFKTEF